MPPWIFPLITLVLAGFSPLLAWWGSTRYFAGRWEEQTSTTRDWRLAVEKRLDALDASIQSGSHAALSIRVIRAEQDILDLREWKHIKGDPYIGAVDVLKARVDILDRRQNERLRGG